MATFKFDLGTEVDIGGQTGKIVARAEFGDGRENRYLVCYEVSLSVGAPQSVRPTQIGVASPAQSPPRKKTLHESWFAESALKDKPLEPI